MQPKTHRHPDSDAGLTLIEIVVTISLMGLIILPLLNATMTVTKASATTRAAANVETAIINAVDRVNRAPSTECDYTRFAEAAVLTQGWSADRASLSQAYLEDGNWITGPTDGEACPDTGNRPRLVKRVRISITSPDDKVTRTVEVVKSDV